MLIRKLKKEDVEDICRIEAAITQTPNKDYFKRTIEKQAMREGGASFVADYNGRVVGYMISYILSGGFGISKSAWIALLGVNPKFMGQGIGAKLARKIFKRKGLGKWLKKKCPKRIMSPIMIPSMQG